MIKVLQYLYFTDVKINPLERLSSTSSRAVAIALTSSRLTLFTGGRFNVNVAIPDLSFTSRLTSFVAATEIERFVPLLSTDRNIRLNDWRNILIGGI